MAELVRASHPTIRLIVLCSLVIGLVAMVAVFIAIGLVRLPLQAVLLVAVPISLAIVVVMRRRATA